MTDETDSRVGGSTGPSEDVSMLKNIKLGGLITSAVGAGLMIFLRAIDTREPAYLVGLIPLLVGLALLTYSYVLATKD